MNVLRASDTTIKSLERLHSRAEGQIVQNDFKGAIHTYLDILMLEPDDEAAYEGLGTCYLLMGHYRKAAEAYHNALSINPENESALLGLQKIMDPDGVEGMIHPSQVDAEAMESAFEPVAALLKPLHTFGRLERADAEKTKPLLPPRPPVKSPSLDAVDAREIQKALRNTGFYSGPIDGILGPGSRKAVKDYQVLHELAPDGIVGQRTWASLRLYRDPNEA